MDIIIIIIAAYVFVSSLLFAAMRFRCRRNAVFKAPRSRGAYLALSLTWGLPATLAGAFAALFLMMRGKKPVSRGYNYFFELDKIDWGVSLGLFCIVPRGCSIGLIAHEHGHGIQNVYFGIFMPLVVNLPSSMRFVCRKLKLSLFRKRPKHAYDDVWFERSATESGKAFFARYEEEQNNNIIVKTS